ncbi:MAG: hypothetical protein IJ437_03740 [Clostridia bacterium]|nr:hypothetical protein [Clostridia bacterium]
MAKSSYEKLLEKQIKQAKDTERKRERDARQDAIRERAASIVNGQPFVCGLRIMDETAEEMLKCLLEHKNSSSNRVSFDYGIFPNYVQMSISLELEKLVQYGMIGGLIAFVNNGFCDMLPPSLSYFENKEKSLRKQEEEQQKMALGNITNYGNMIFGNVSYSTLTVDNSIHEIERMIDKQGGEDKETLLELLGEVKELLENIQSSRNIPKQKKLFQRISDHIAKHGWFYGAVVQLLGTATLTMLGT